MAEAAAPVSRQVVQREHQQPEPAGAKVTVYCKLPNGLRLRIFKMRKTSEPVLGGGFRDFELAEPYGTEILINGNRFRIGDPMSHRIIGDYGVTEGVDKDFWEKWLEANKDQPYVKNKLVFASEKKDYGNDMAEELAEVRSGFEPMQKDGDPRAPRPRTNLTGVENYDQKA